MFDVTNTSSYTNAQKWYNEVTRVCPNIPSVLIGNKIDGDRRISIGDVSLQR